MQLPLILVFHTELFDSEQTSSQLQSICKATSKPDLDGREAGTSCPWVFFSTF